MVCRWASRSFSPVHTAALLSDKTRTLASWEVTRPQGAGEALAVALPASSLCTLVWSEEAIEKISIPEEHLEH